MINQKQTWIPLTNEELEGQIERAKANYKPEPRSLSLVRFSDDSSFKKYILDNPNEKDDVKDYTSLLYLGPIPNQSGHGVYVNLKFNTIHVIDIQELVELTEDET